MATQSIIEIMEKRIDCKEEAPHICMPLETKRDCKRSVKRLLHPSIAKLMISTALFFSIIARNQKHVQGLVFIVAAAIIWVLASFVVQRVEDKGLSPFLLSYIANSLFIVYLPLDKLLKHQAFTSAWSRCKTSSVFDDPEFQRQTKYLSLHFCTVCTAACSTGSRGFGLRI